MALTLAVEVRSRILKRPGMLSVPKQLNLQFYRLFSLERVQSSGIIKCAHGAVTSSTAECLHHIFTKPHLDTEGVNSGPCERMEHLSWRVTPVHVKFEFCLFCSVFFS